MSTDNQQIWQLAEAYVMGTMSNPDRAALEFRMKKDPELAATFHECAGLIASLNNSGREMRFRDMLRDIHQDVVNPVSVIETKSAPKAVDTEETKGKAIPLHTHIWRTAAVAAGIAMLTSFTSVWIYRSIDRSSKSDVTQLSRLHNELERIKSSQHQLNQKIDKIKDSPIAPGNLSGTGFALTNNGYLVTNYHVAKDADSIYIQTREGNYHKAFVVGFDDKTDVAVLKVEDKKFHFSKTDVPYTFAGAKAGLGSKVYTLGYPADEVVYSEGYISSKNGLRGDSIQYRLELPAAPGQSGAPVMDNHGNVLGIVTSKESASEGTTYAVSNKALFQVLHSLPKDVNIHLPKVNKLGKLGRDQQIEKLEEFTCIVQVYKR